MLSDDTPGSHILMTSPTAAAVSAAAGLPLFSVPNHPPDNHGYDNGQTCQYDNRSHLYIPPSILPVFYSRSGLCAPAIWLRLVPAELFSL